MGTTAGGEETHGSPLVLAGRYRVVRTLESVDTGATFLVYDVRLRRWRSMDIPWPGQPSAAKRLVAQAEKLARLEHPAVERVVDLGAEGALAFVVRDRLHGSLNEQLDLRGALTPAMATATVARLADGLAHAHSVGLVHGQIRPRLVRFADDAGVVLTGFGELRIVDATTAGRVAEPWAHLAPEQRVEWNPDEAGDVYALGSLLHTLVVGRYNADLFRAAASDKALAAVPEVLRAIVLRACTRDPRARYPSAEAFGGVLESLAGALGPVGTPPWSLDIESLPPSSADGVAPDDGVKELLRVIARNRRTEPPSTKTPIPSSMPRVPDTAPALAERRFSSTIPPERTDPVSAVKVFGLNTGETLRPRPPAPKRVRDTRMLLLAGLVLSGIAAVVGAMTLIFWLATAGARADAALTEAIALERVTAESLARYAPDRAEVERAWFAFNDAPADEKAEAAATFARVAISIREGVAAPLPDETAAAIDRMESALKTWEARLY